MKIANNRKFEYSQLKVFLLHQDSSKKSETMRMLLNLLYPDNNQFEKSNKKALRPNGPDES